MWGWSQLTFIFSELKAKKRLDHLLKSTALQMNSVSYKAVMGSCERWEQWRECMSLLVDQHLGGIKTNFGAYALPFLASEKSKWEGESQLLRNAGDQRLDFDATLNGAVVSSTNWKWSMMLLRDSRVLVDLDCLEVSKPFFDGAEWSVASLLLSELQEMQLQSDSEASFSLASSLCRKGMWWKSLLVSQELGQLGVTSEVLVLNSFSTALQWSEALAALGRMEPGPGLVDYDVLVMVCWKCEENFLAAQLLRESQGLRSPISFSGDFLSYTKRIPGWFMPRVWMPGWHWGKLQDHRTSTWSLHGGPVQFWALAMRGFTSSWSSGSEIAYQNWPWKS